MKYLSFDLEATGLEEDARIIEFAMIPFDTKEHTLNHELSKQFYVKCPSFEELEPNLNPWVKEHNKELIQKAHKEGVSMDDFKTIMEDYLNSKEVKEYHQQKETRKSQTPPRSKDIDECFIGLVVRPQLRTDVYSNLHRY